MEDDWQFVTLKDRFNAAALSIGTAAASIAPLAINFKPSFIAAAAGLGLLFTAFRAINLVKPPIADNLRNGNYRLMPLPLRQMKLDIRHAAGLKNLHGYIGADASIMPSLKKDEAYFEIMRNAAFSMPDFKTVVISETMAQHYGRDSLRFVLAHEASHIRTGDGTNFPWLLGTVSELTLTTSLSLSMGAGLFSMLSGENLAGHVFAHGSLMTAIPVIAGALCVRMTGMNILSRMRERRADRNALYLTRDFNAAVAFIEKAYENNRPRAWLKFLKTHPSRDERIDNLKTAWETIRLYPPAVSGRQSAVLNAPPPAPPSA
jgi:Zn-dependent protease with chaperone function